MIIVLQKWHYPEQQQELIKIFDKYENLKLNFAHGTQTTVIGLIGDTSSVDIDEGQSQDVVDKVTRDIRAIQERLTKVSAQKNSNKRRKKRSTEQVWW